MARCSLGMARCSPVWARCSWVLAWCGRAWASCSLAGGWHQNVVARLVVVPTLGTVKAAGADLQCARASICRDPERHTVLPRGRVTARRVFNGRHVGERGPVVDRETDRRRRAEMGWGACGQVHNASVGVNRDRLQTAAAGGGVERQRNQRTARISGHCGPPLAKGGKGASYGRVGTAETLAPDATCKSVCDHVAAQLCLVEGEADLLSPRAANNASPSGHHQPGHRATVAWVCQSICALIAFGSWTGGRVGRNSGSGRWECNPGQAKCAGIRR
jgi:hypothetical protein